MSRHHRPLPSPAPPQVISVALFPPSLTRRGQPTVQKNDIATKANSTVMMPIEKLATQTMDRPIFSNSRVLPSIKMFSKVFTAQEKRLSHIKNLTLSPIKAHFRHKLSIHYTPAISFVSVFDKLADAARERQIRLQKTIPEEIDDSDDEAPEQQSPPLKFAGTFPPAVLTKQKSQ
jgi:hypothetical protein